MKKAILMFIGMVLVLALSVSGTLAYLTDGDNEIDQFSAGNVDIRLQENFVQGSELLPGKPVTKQIRLRNDGLESAWVWYTYAVPAALDNQLQVNHVKAHVNGLHTDPANYEAAGYTAPVEEDQTWHLEEGNPDGSRGICMGEATYDDVAYNVYGVLYHGILKPGERTTVAMEQVLLDEEADLADYHLETASIYVTAYAIQADLAGVDSVQEAAGVYNSQL